MSKFVNCHEHTSQQGTRDVLRSRSATQTQHCLIVRDRGYALETVLIYLGVFDIHSALLCAEIPTRLLSLGGLTFHHKLLPQ
ncbi:MAG: hypothetical protein QNJ54_18840 [Prochloraceae cyanobacterium]|nr:hypothetical protein [Prochloraceae cyanobacterium]